MQWVSVKTVLLIVLRIMSVVVVVVGLQHWESKHIYCADHVLELTTKTISDHTEMEAIIEVV